MFVPKNLPDRKAILAFTKRFEGMAPRVAESYLHFIRCASLTFEALEQHFGRHGISQGRFAVLMLLLRRENKRLTPAELADAIGVTRATITGLVDGLQKSGLVRREPHERDRRRVVVQLTPEGMTFMERLLPEHFRRMGNLMSALTTRDCNDLIRLTKKIESGLDALRLP